MLMESENKTDKFLFHTKVAFLNSSWTNYLYTPIAHSTAAFPELLKVQCA